MKINKINIVVTTILLVVFLVSFSQAGHPVRYEHHTGNVDKVVNDGKGYTTIYIKFISITVDLKLHVEVLPFKVPTSEVPANVKKGRKLVITYTQYQDSSKIDYTKPKIVY